VRSHGTALTFSLLRADVSTDDSEIGVAVVRGVIDGSRQGVSIAAEETE
jgi:hypothetical protein